MPRRVFLPNWVWNVALASVFVASWLSTDSLWLFLGLVAAAFIQGIYVFHFVRCPVCNGSLTFHQARIPHTTRYRFQLACAHCKIIWDTGKISDDSN